jgi:hypothetical protein
MFTVDHHSRVACRWLNSFIIIRASMIQNRIQCLTVLQHQFEVKTTLYYSNTVAPIENSVLQFFIGHCTYSTDEQYF